ncbi:adenylosuccinate lyase, partial [Acinetobacter baumannii]
FDLRLLQSPGWGEWFEPAGTAQVSSSAMPSKRNPVDAETICSLARFLSAMPGIAWNNAAHALFERTLDDAANRNEILTCAFLATDEILLRARRI